MAINQYVASAVTLAISVVLKDIINWLFSLIKTLSVIATIKEKVKAIFSKANREIMAELLCLMILLFTLVNFVSGSTPATRLDGLLTLGLVVAIIINITSLLWHIGGALEEREKKKKDAS